jgi:metallo-beta-lactamase family protein
MPGLHFARSTAESKAINAVRAGAVILAGAGMCTGGRIKHHLAQHLPRPESTILFVGYQAAGTLGREIAEGAPNVRIHGCRCPVRARIAQIGGFSAHADRDELLRWLGGLRTPPRRTFVVHGEPEAARALADLAAQRLGHRVTVPKYGDRVALD